MGQPVVLADFGLTLRARGRRFVVSRGRSVVCEYAAGEVEEVFVLGPGKAVTVEAVRLAVSNRIPVYFSYADGTPYCALLPLSATGTVVARREQYKAYYDGRGLRLARAFVAGKVVNQSRLLREYARRAAARGRGELAGELRAVAGELDSIAAEVHQVEGVLDGAGRRRLMALEAQAASLYWEMFSRLIPGGWGFPGRVKRGAGDPVNMMLNLGYGLLRARVHTAVFYAGLDPYAGYLHADRSGRESLTLDLMEEFRQVAVDRVVLKLLNLRAVRREGFSEGRIRQPALSRVVEAFEEEMERSFPAPGGGKVKLKRAIHRQARMVARFLVSGEEYVPFTAW